MNPIDWTIYYIKYQHQYRDFHNYSYYENHLNCIGIAKILLSIYITELINQIDFTQYNINNFIVNLPLTGAYDTKIFWTSEINNVLIAKINRLSEDQIIPEIYRTVDLFIQIPIKKLSSKKAIPFINEVFHETNSNCPICWQIDQLYTKVFVESNDVIYQQILKNLDDNFLVNGYSLLSVFEKNGYHTALDAYKQKILKLKEYNSIHGEYIGSNNQIEKNLFLDKPRLIHSRWCRHCGSRKPDIYEEGRETDE